MKVNILEAHDRLKYFIKDQSAVISQGCEDCLKKNPLSIRLQQKSPYIYIFAHARTADDGVNKKLFWQPRLAKPKAQTNSMLWRVKSYTDILETCWIIPPREMWEQYKFGKVTESEIVIWSIDQFINNRENLEKSFPEDFSSEKIKQIYQDIAEEMEYEHAQQKMMKRSYDILAGNDETMPPASEESST